MGSIARASSATDRTSRRALLVLLFAVAAGPVVAGCRTRSSVTDGARAGGTVEIANGYPLLVRGDAGLELLMPAPGATLLGMDDIDTPGSGDPIRWTGARDAAGVKVAEVIELGPLVQTEAALQISSDRVRELFGRGAPVGTLSVDARPADEFARGHLAGAVSLSPDRLDRAGEILPADRNAELVFYSRSRRCPLAVAAMRRARSLGYVNARVFLGGFQEWISAGLPLEISGAELEAMLGGGEPAIVMDVRPREEADRASIPGAVSRPVAELSFNEFARGLWLPPIVIVGRGAGDPDVQRAAASLRQWRFLDQRPVPAWFLVLAGGFERWAADGRKVATGPLPTALPYSPTKGEIPPREFMALWNDGANNGDRVQFLDVRPVRSAPEWVKHIRLEELPARLGELPRDREIVVFCTVGKRSTIAREILERNGFRARSLRARFPQPAL